MIVAVERVTIDLVVLDQFGAHLDQIVAPRAEVAADSRAEVVFFRSDLENRSGVIGVNSPIGMSFHEFNGRKGRQAEAQLYAGLVAIIHELAKLDVFVFGQAAAVFAKGKVRPDRVGMHDLNTVLGRFGDLAGIQIRHAGDVENPVGNLNRLKGHGRRGPFPGRKRQGG